MLGFEIFQTSPALGGADRFHWVWLKHGGAELMLNTAYEFDKERPIQPDKLRTDAHGDTGLFISCPEVDAACAKLRDKGEAITPPRVAPYGMKQMHLRAPDGYGICFQRRVET